jgi:hypothetical protein
VTPEQQVKTFIAKFDPKNQALIRQVRTALREWFPTGSELVYDNYNFFVLGYGPTERPSDAVVSMACSSNGIGLCFIHGATLPDPKKVLRGAGNQTRFIHLDSAETLTRPEVETLLSVAIERARTPFPTSGKRKLIVRSVSAKQRPRRTRVTAR